MRKAHKSQYTEIEYAEIKVHNRKVALTVC